MSLEFDFYDVVAKHGSKIRKELMEASKKSPDALARNVGFWSFEDFRSLSVAGVNFLDCGPNTAYRKQKVADEIFLLRYVSDGLRKENKNLRVSVYPRLTK